MNDDFGVGAGAESVPAGRKFFREFLEIIDLAIEHNGHAAILVIERLLSC